MSVGLSMKRFASAALCAFALSSGAAQACGGVALWQLEAEDGGRAVLMGTVHLLPGDDGWADARVRQAVKDADMLVIEALTDTKNNQTLQAFALQQGFIGPSQPLLPARLTQADAKALSSAEALLNLPAGATSRMQPWLAALNLTLAAVMQHGFVAEQGAEAWLKTRFEKEDEPVGALEGPLDGLRAIAALPEELQIEMLRAAIEEARRGGEDIKELYKVWLNGDQKALTAIVTDPSQFHPEVHEAILAQRNKNWIAPILAYLETPEEEFIAVGAAHLVGPDDLISLLRQSGVRVERLR